MIMQLLRSAVQQACLALPRSFLMSEDRMSPTRTPRISTRFCLLHVEHNLQRVFLSIVWYHQSSVSVVFPDICFRQWYHVGYVCIDYQLGLHGRITVASFVWLLPGNNMSSAPPLLLSCWFCVPSNWFASSFCTCPSRRRLVFYCQLLWLSRTRTHTLPQTKPKFAWACRYTITPLLHTAYVGYVTERYFILSRFELFWVLSSI